MEAITSLGILFVVVFIVYFLIREFRNEISSKGKRQITQEEYGEIKQKWNKKQIENLEEAIKMYPSKHLMNNNEEWEKMVERQRDYAAKKDVLYAKQLQGEYNLTEEEWKKLESQIFIEDAEKLQKDPEFQKVLNEIKNQGKVL